MSARIRSGVLDLSDGQFTSATILLNVPVVLASLYGMNVPLPGQHSDGAFAAILALAGTLMGVTAFVFWRRRWL